ncbi:hypothetical protein CapIbe_012224 [Capra ibex]
MQNGNGTDRQVRSRKMENLSLSPSVSWIHCISSNQQVKGSLFLVEEMTSNFRFTQSSLFTVSNEAEEPLPWEGSHVMCS